MLREASGVFLALMTLTDFESTLTGLENLFRFLTHGVCNTAQLGACVKDNEHG